MQSQTRGLKIAVLGAGAAGFFAALAAKESYPLADVFLFERSSTLLGKVKISGGGRCNVTHACFDPKLLVQHYPRGHRELLGPFHQFQPSDTVEWFKKRGITLKRESDGRMFPTTDSSMTIIECFLNEAKKLGVQIITKVKVDIVKTETCFEIAISDHPPLFTNRLILATGSHPKGWEMAERFGHSIVPPVPSLFTFNVPSFPLQDLAGVTVTCANVSLNKRFVQEGPLLITHWGFSGPAALKLSAWAARLLAEKNYEVSLFIDWLPKFSSTQILEIIESKRKAHPARHLGSLNCFLLPQNLWKRLLSSLQIANEPLRNLSKKALSHLCEKLKKDRYEVRGKTTNKDEFVTAGGVCLREIDFRTMESKQCKGLFFCGEILDIDGVTGGFNFQNAWTTGWIAGRSASHEETE